MEKVIEVAEIEDARQMLDICINHHHTGPKINCSMCWKCMRTVVTLDALGKLEDFSAVFDRATYERALKSYLASLLWSKKYQEIKVLELAREKGLVRKGFLGDLELISRRLARDLGGRKIKEKLAQLRS